jgi:hypothetical protein
MRTGHGLLAMLAFLAVGMAACGSNPASPPAGRSGGPTAGPGTGRDVRALAAEYLAIAGPANHRLEGEEKGYTANAHRNLAAAESALRAQAATERWFDSRLLAIKLPALIAATARALVRANQSRIALTELQARSASIGALLTFVSGHRAADAAVEVQVRIIRLELGLPPPETS